MFYLSYICTMKCTQNHENIWLLFLCRVNHPNAIVSHQFIVNKRNNSLNGCFDDDDDDEDHDKDNNAMDNLHEHGNIHQTK